MCQDTGTAIVVGKRTETVLTGGNDEEAISRGVFEAYDQLNLRYSQMAPTSFWDERNTGTNLPAQVELYSVPGAAPRYELLVMAKGGGSANKTFLYQETKALLNPKRLASVPRREAALAGHGSVPALPPGDRRRRDVGGVHPQGREAGVGTLPGHPAGDRLRRLGHAFRDRDLEQQVLELTRGFGIGAQFGGKYFCHDVRVIRLPRHGASLPVGDRGVVLGGPAGQGEDHARTGVFLEQLERDPARFLPDVTHEHLDDTGGEVVRIDLNRPMAEIRGQLSALPVKTRVSLTGPLVVARDIAHAKIAERLEAGEPMPAYLRDHPVYYAGPAKTPEGYASGSFGPTTAGRMDSYVEQFQAAGGSLVMLAKGNRSTQVTTACATYGGFYLGSIGGPAARLAQDCIRSVDVLEYPELGMEAVWKIEVEDFPAFVVVDDKGNDFFAETSTPTLQVGFRR